MKGFRRIGTIIACSAAVAVCAIASSANKELPANWDGLEKRDIKGLQAVYVRPNVTFPAYKKVMLDPVQVEFDKNWDPNSSKDLSTHLSSQDMQKIKTGLAQLMLEGFTNELTKGGYPINASPDDDTLRASTALVHVYINAPQTTSSSRSRTYTTDAGSATFVMELRDAPSGQLLARVVDSRRADDFGNGRMMWTNSVTNRADAQLMIANWAKKLREAMDRLNGK